MTSGEKAMGESKERPDAHKGNLYTVKIVSRGYPLSFLGAILGDTKLIGSDFIKAQIGSLPENGNSGLIIANLDEDFANTLVWRLNVSYVNRTVNNEYNPDSYPTRLPDKDSVAGQALDSRFFSEDRRQFSAYIADNVDYNEVIEGSTAV